MKKENIIKKMWNKTVFPDIIKKRKEEKEFKKEIEEEAMEEAKPEIRKQLKEQYKQKIIEKSTKEKKPLKTFAEQLKLNLNTDKVIGGNTHKSDEMFSQDKIRNMMGGKQTTTTKETTDNIFSQDKIENMLGKKIKKPETKEFDVDSKLKRMMNK